MAPNAEPNQNLGSISSDSLAANKPSIACPHPCGGPTCRTALHSAFVEDSRTSMEFSAAKATESGDQLLMSVAPGPNQRSSPPPTNTATLDGGLRTAASLSVADRDYLEHMEGMAELRAKMRRRPLRVRCRAFVPSARNLASADDNEGVGGGDNDNDGPTRQLHVVKVVHLVRHGQGFHNLMADLYHEAGRSWTQFVASPNNPYTRIELTDSPLTEVGRRQAEALQGRVRALCDDDKGAGPPPPQLVVSSPHTRALQTALLAFEPLRENPLSEAEAGAPSGCLGRVPFVAHEMLREETGVHVCDQRRPASRLRREFEPHVDFALLPENDELFRAYRRETKEEVGDRAYRFLEWLEARPERHVAVSSHSAWLLTLLNGVCECEEDDNDDPSVRTWFQTGEMRSVEMHFHRAGP